MQDGRTELNEPGWLMATYRQQTKAQPADRGRHCQKALLSVRGEIGPPIPGRAAVFFGDPDRGGCRVQRSQCRANHPAAASQSAMKTVTEHLVNGRFTVTMSGAALQETKAAGDDLPALMAHVLAHISALLPGPRSAITVNYAQGSALIAQAGAYGFTNPADERTGPARQDAGPGS